MSGVASLPMERPSPAPLRVLTRPSSAAPPPPPPSPSAPPPDGVVVVGIVGRSSDDVTQLLNRILDARVFGPGGRDRDLFSRSRDGDESGIPSSPRLSYYHEEGKGVVYVQLSYLNEGPLVDAQSDDLKAMLLMFCVCHIVIYVHEGSRFDTQILKRLRTLQAARQALVPFIKSHVTPLLSSKHSSSASVNVSVRSNSSDTPPALRGGSNSGRHASAISYMSGLSSSPSLYPGHYVPLLLFAMLDAFPEGLSLPSQVHDPTDGSAIAQSSTTSFHRPTLPAKGPASVVMLTRPSSKVEANNRRKLQSSLEAQIRSLVRKSRILTGTERSYSAARSGAHVMFSPLFFLDSSRAIVLLDKHLNCRGESLDFTTGLVIKDMLNSNLSLETMIQESSNQNLSKEDFQSVKDVIHCQIDALRGKGGLATNSGPTAAVGMVAVAAAAAAASAASGKPPQSQSPPRLPTFGDWISCTHRFFDYLLCRHYLEKEKGNDKYITANEKEALNAVDTCLSLLESGTNLNMKFSTAWCIRALPAAKEVYLKDLPPCYPTVIHDSQLERALRAFNLMVKGPAMQYFGKKLAEECNSIWKSGRQLCDAVSLTGKQCVHQRHVVSMSDSSSDIEVKPHYSGYVFLHACPCGRSRQLHSDPFDFKSANTKFSCSANCENLLPAMQIPKTGNDIEFYVMSWNLIRVGGAKYYEPSKGLLQSGFCSTEKFLSKWTIFLEDQILPNGMTKTVISQKASTILQSCSAPSLVGESETKKASPGTVDHLTKSSEFLISDDPKIKFGKGLPHFPLKKPFLEVVAGSISSELAFPPLPPKKQSIPNDGNGNRQKLSRDKVEDKNLVTNAMKFPLKEDRLSKDSSDFGREDGDPFLQIGSNVVPVNVNGGGKLKANTCLKEVVVYIGFEHECPCGHRFLLSPEHLNELDLKALSKDSRASVTPASNKHPDAKSLEHSYVGDKNRTNEPSKLYKRTAEEFKSANDLMGCLNEIRHDDGGFAFPLLNRNLPIYMNCPHCKNSRSKINNEKSKFASTISQLQRIFVVTPSFPVVLATSPVVQFEDSCLPPTIKESERHSKFSLGCGVILPPDSFLTLRLPFIYGVQLEDKSLHPLKCLDQHPENAAWIVKGTTLRIMSIGGNPDEEFYK